MKILMVCKGNICRSPLAEGVLRELSASNKLNWEIDSAAIKAFHIGKAPDSRAIHTAQKHNIDISCHKCRLLTTEDFDDFDIIYAMSQDILDFMQEMAPKDKHHKLRLLMSEVDASVIQDVPDPFHGEEKDFDYAYDLILLACEKIIEKQFKA
ncbi:low molecular weight phosphotyrosine protein phosphatase [Dysgonomonas sp. HDW5B]|uniref:low molecular weight protein-tyrosine-phosphatase n=1 Tax=Dysgonomonas sp. HDW5B TaxID=2714927 RepID=UPI00140929E9|nr:low molecular weight protein-tyrosine-phosphatase [Dysgonomonas sp. HDW5B]QIK54328.1 low molecular weight phosphotyrosine protein phosphatase [Dysgonomonas sp. HDW5B]